MCATRRITTCSTCAVPQHIPLASLSAAIPELLLEPAANTVYVLMSNDEAAATEAWKLLSAESVPNVYILGRRD